MIWFALVPFDVDPNVVKPGWTPLFITILLALAMVGLFVSMRRQFRRIDTNRAAGGFGGPDDAARPGEAGPAEDAQDAPQDAGPESRPAAGPTS